MELGAGSLVLEWPDYRLRTYQPDELGEWLITADPIDYGPHVRVDYRDDQTGTAGTWFLPASRKVRVALIGRELQQQAAEVLNLLASRTWLPEVSRWEVTENGLEGLLVHTYTDQDAQAVEKWREYLESAETHSAEITPGLTRVWVAALVCDVPVSVSAHTRTPKTAQPPTPSDPPPSAIECRNCDVPLTLSSPNGRWLHVTSHQEECAPGADPARYAQPMMQRLPDGSAQPPADSALLERVHDGLVQLDAGEVERA
ncbi:hypothetical protein EBO15_28475 [Actinomadura harenae]|uniref:Uncharacterized protein n=1 Tax=Actinomadura harenae TaxID=2483351 RepID=A0A3M2LQY7_9ACTN|nr:hypothetical protein EBO15_28475 [Actinomadura harenae]